MLSEDDASVALRVGGLLVTTIDTLSAEPSVSSSTVDVVPGDLSTTASVAVGGYVSGRVPKHAFLVTIAAMNPTVPCIFCDGVMIWTPLMDFSC